MNYSLFHVILWKNVYRHVSNVSTLFTMDGRAGGALFGTYSLIDFNGGKAHAPCVGMVHFVDRRKQS